MIGKAIEFRSENGDIKTGIVLDKVQVLPVGAAANYDNYVVAEIKTAEIEIINPLNIKKVIIQNQ